MIDQVLHHGPITWTCLAARASMHENQCRHLVISARAMWFVKGGWNLQLVKALVANNLTADEVVLIDDRIQCLGQLPSITIDPNR